MDTALLALVYLIIGFYFKQHIKKLITAKNWKLDIAGIVLLLAIILFCYIDFKNGMFYTFAMKPLKYKELATAVLIPCAFGFVLTRIICWINKFKLFTGLCSVLGCLGQMTIPVMFLHVPLNYWQETFGYGNVIYVVIGIGVPVLLSLMLGRINVARKCLGLPRHELLVGTIKYSRGEEG